MPRVVDKQERKRHIADAVFRVVGRQGLGRAGLRDVAAEAGVSMGAVQHYFSTRDEMLLFALDHMQERVLARLPSQPTGGSRDYRASIGAAMRVMLPLDHASRDEAAVNIAFFAEALGNPRYQELLHQGYQRLLNASRDQLRAAAAAHQLARGVDPDKEAAALFFLTQGLIGPLLIGVLPKYEAERLIDGRLDRIFRRR